jgi:hypothetical protein
MKEALSKADFVQENGPERPDFKMELFVDMAAELGRRARLRRFAELPSARFCRVTDQLTLGTSFGAKTPRHFLDALSVESL